MSRLIWSVQDSGEHFRPKHTVFFAISDRKSMMVLLKKNLGDFNARTVLFSSLFTAINMCMCSSNEPNSAQMVPPRVSTPAEALVWTKQEYYFLWNQKVGRMERRQTSIILLRTFCVNGPLPDVVDTNVENAPLTTHALLFPPFETTTVLLKT